MSQSQMSQSQMSQSQMSQSQMSQSQEPPSSNDDSGTESETSQSETPEAPSFEQAVELLDTIPGIDKLTAQLIVAELGIDMSRFPTAKHAAAWAGLAPGNNESGGKRRSGRTKSRSGRTKKGNRALRSGLLQAAWAARPEPRTPICPPNIADWQVDVVRIAPLWL